MNKGGKGFNEKEKTRKRKGDDMMGKSGKRKRKKWRELRRKTN